MIKLGHLEPLLKAKGLDFDEGQDSNIRLPKVAIGVFSKHLFNSIVDKYHCKEVGRIRNVNFTKRVYILSYKKCKFTIFLAGVGASAIASDIEILHAQGVEKVIIFGSCSVLDSTIEDCSIVVPNLAFREEGTSYHYVEASDTIEINPKYQKVFIKILKKFGFGYTIGSVWTTDVFYRETIDKIDYFKKKGAKAVDMEASAIAAVCQVLNMEHFIFYYAGDNLDCAVWDARSLEELANIEKKKAVVILALELAQKMSQQDKTSH